MSKTEMTRDAARKRDEMDPLRSFKDAFFDSGEDLIYLDGNSLGRLPKKTRTLLTNQVDVAWGGRLIRSWNDSWIDLPARLSKKLAQLLGASADEILFCDATSMNLYKLAHAALQIQRPRKEIITDSLNFPSDLYVLQGVLDQFTGAPPLHIVGGAGDVEGPLEQIRAQLSPKTALLSLSLVTYKSAYFYPLKALTEAAHAVGALVLWDLSHAAGAVEIDLQDAGVDLAVGCSYKYLNGGPGAPAYLFVRQGLRDELQSPIKGWFGDQRPFEFETTYAPAKGISRFAVGTPPILSMAAIEPGLDMLLEAGLPALRKKSLALQDVFLGLFQDHLAPLGFSLGSPMNPDRRGSHLSLIHKDAGRICQALIDPPEDRPVIIPDFRAPHTIRLGMAPLYVSFENLWDTAERLVKIILDKEYLGFDERPKGVT